jgi:hypothetical protein
MESFGPALPVLISNRSCLAFNLRHRWPWRPDAMKIIHVVFHIRKSIMVLEADLVRSAAPQEAFPASLINRVLATQIAVAWAGEGGGEGRLGWWRTDLAKEYGGRDLFQRLLPRTSEWALLQSLREVARRRDEELQRQDHDPDRILSLYSLGFALDERVEERMQDLKRSGQTPMQALPALSEVLSEKWDPAAFAQWVRGHGTVSVEKEAIGRRLRGAPPESLELLIRNLVAALWPLSAAYPLPHYRKAK